MLVLCHLRRSCLLAAVVGSTAVVALGACLIPAGSAGAETPPLLYKNFTQLGASPPEQVFGWGQVTFDVSGIGNIHCSALMQGSVSNSGGVGVGEVTDFTSAHCEEPPPRLCEEEGARLPCEGFRHDFITMEMPPAAVGRGAELCGGIEKPPCLEPPASSREAEFCREAGRAPAQCPEEAERETGTLYTRIARRESPPWQLQLVRGEREEEEAVLARLGGPGSSCYPTEKVVVEGKEVERRANWEAVPAGCVKLNLVFPQAPLEIVCYGKLEVWLLNGVRTGLFPSRLEFVEAGKLIAGSASVSGPPQEEAVLTGSMTLVGSRQLELITAK